MIYFARKAYNVVTRIFMPFITSINPRHASSRLRIISQIFPRGFPTLIGAKKFVECIRQCHRAHRVRPCCEILKNIAKHVFAQRSAVRFKNTNYLWSMFHWLTCSFCGRCSSFNGFNVEFYLFTYCSVFYDVVKCKL